jgi:hypothetical protein
MARKRVRETAFETPQPLVGYGVIAGNHWLSANELLELARAEVKASPSGPYPHSHRVSSAICLYHATLDCHLNETLAWNTSPSLHPDQEVEYQARLEIVRQLQDLTGEQKAERIVAAMGLTDKFKPEVIEGYRQLDQLRKLAYHHSPAFEPTNVYPPVLLRIMAQRGIKKVNMQWSNWLEHMELLEWARETAQQFIEELDRCTGREPTLNSFWSGFLTKDEMEVAWETFEAGRKKKVEAED